MTCIRLTGLLGLLTVLTGCSAAGTAIGGLTVGMTLDKVDTLIQNAIETADSRVGRQQGILFAGLKGTIGDVRTAYREELDHTVASLSTIEQQVFRDLDGRVVEMLNIAEDVDRGLEARILQMHSAMNQILDRLPLTKKEPVLLTVVPVFGEDPTAADLVIYGYRLGNDLDEGLRPDVRINDITLPPESVTVDYDRLSARLPEGTEDRIKALFSPCGSVKEIVLDVTFRYRKSWFLGLGSSVQEVHLHRAIPMPEAFRAVVMVEYQPQKSPGVSAPIPYSFDSPSYTTQNPGAFGSESIKGTLLYIAPDDATNLTVTKSGWHRISTMVGTRHTADAPVVTGKQISLKGVLTATKDWGGRRWGHLFVEGTFTRPETQIRSFAPRTEQNLAFINGRAQLAVSSPEDVRAVPSRIVVTLFRDACLEEADRIELVTHEDGSGEAQSRAGRFTAKILGGSLTISQGY